MVDQTHIVNVDITSFVKDAKNILDKHWPSAIANGVRLIAKHVHFTEQRHTSSVFSIRNKGLLKGIRYYPSTESQLEITKKMLKRGSCEGAVFLRGSHDPKRSLQFLADHQFGETRKPKDRKIAAPIKVKQFSYRTATGKTRKRWKPSTLLDRYRSSGSKFVGTTTQSKTRNKKGHLPSAPFLIGRGKNIFIVRRISKKDARNKKGKLQFLYVLLPSVKMRKKYNFIETAFSIVFAHGTKHMINAINENMRKVR